MKECACTSTTTCAVAVFTVPGVSAQSVTSREKQKVLPPQSVASLSIEVYSISHAPTKSVTRYPVMVHLYFKQELIAKKIHFRNPFLDDRDPKLTLIYHNGAQSEVLD